MRLLTSIVAMLITVAVLSAEAPISLSSQVRVATEPADFRIVITVPKSAENRKVCLVADGGDYSSSCWPWDGEDAPYVKSTWLKRLSAGEYTVVAILVRADGSQSRAQMQLTVSERGTPYVR